MTLLHLMYTIHPQAICHVRAYLEIEKMITYSEEYDVLQALQLSAVDLNVYKHEKQPLIALAIRSS